MRLPHTATLDKDLRVTRNKASSAHLKQMGSVAAWLILDVIPSTLDEKKDRFATWTEATEGSSTKCQPSETALLAEPVG